MNVGDILGLSTDLLHDTFTTGGLRTTPSCEVHATAHRVPPPTGALWPRCAIPWELIPVHDLAGVLCAVLPQSRHRSAQLSLTLLLLLIMLLLIFPIHLVPFLRIRRLVGLGLELQREVLLDELQPQLAGQSLYLRRVGFDATELIGIFDTQKNVSDVFVWEEVADAVEVFDVFDTGARGQIDQRSDGHSLDQPSVRIS